MASHRASNVLNPLQAFFARGVKDEVLPHNPTEGIEGQTGVFWLYNRKRPSGEEGRFWGYYREERYVSLYMWIRGR
jgi:hypothetical protein